MLGITIHIFNGMNEWIGRLQPYMDYYILYDNSPNNLDGYTMKGKKRQTNNEIRLGKELEAQGGGIIISTLQHLINSVAILKHYRKHNGVS